MIDFPDYPVEFMQTYNARYVEGLKKTAARRLEMLIEIEHVSDRCVFCGHFDEMKGKLSSHYAGCEMVKELKRNEEQA